MKADDLIKMYIPIFITYIALFLREWGVNASIAYLSTLILIVISFLIFYKFLPERPPLEFKTIVELQKQSARIIFKFRNNTKKVISIRSYRFEITMGDRTLLSTIPHPYGRAIEPKKNWQEEPFDWSDLGEYKIESSGKYQIFSIISYNLNGEYKELSDVWEGNIII